MSPALHLILAGLAQFALSGVAGLPGACSPARGRSQVRAALLMVSGGITGLAGALLQLASGQDLWLSLNSGLAGSRPAVHLDDLAAWFLVPVFVLPALAAVYGIGYRPARGRPTGSRRLDLAQGLLAAAMGTVVLAGDGLTFLLAWEAMALAAWLAATVEGTAEVREAGWVYLVATHAGTLFLFALFACWEQLTGSLTLEPATTLAVGEAGILLALGLVGFGLKAGLMPLHFWLPGLHSGAPSQVSAVLSGVMLKLGVYGLVRLTFLLPGLERGWGVALVLLGCLSAVGGITRGLLEGRIKRLLACSSIENIGLITAGLGLAVLGRAQGEPAWVTAGMGACLLHVWNHASFKGLLFLGAGSVMHACGGDRLDRLGGLARRMPRTTTLLFAGSLAACALPPLNGFASEWLLYTGFFRVLDSPAGSGGLAYLALAAAALGLAGALTLATFVKLLGTGLLGEPRSEPAVLAHESGTLLLGPAAVLAVLVVALGPGAALLGPWLQRVIALWLAPSGPGSAATELPALSALALPALLLVMLATGLYRALGRRRAGDRSAPTWDCGYALPDARMQTTATGLADSAGEFLLPGRTRQSPAPRITGIFPGPARLLQARADLLLERRIKPSLGRLAHTLHRLRVFQQGRTEHYVLYILAALLLMLLAGGRP